MFDGFVYSFFELIEVFFTGAVLGFGENCIGVGAEVFGVFDKVFFLCFGGGSCEGAHASHSFGHYFSGKLRVLM